MSTLVTTTNPFWDEAASLFIFPPLDDWNPARIERIDKEMENYRQREGYCRRYAWAVPDPAALHFVAQHLAPRAAIEIGAGTGYWAWQLAQLGIDILAYDGAPPDQDINVYFVPLDAKTGQRIEKLTKTYYSVQRGGPEVLADHPDRTLFLCWPPYNDAMADQCLQHYRGNRLVFIGEDEGGCTGDDAFFERLDKDWEEIGGSQIVQWFGIHDTITVYERKKAGER